MTTSVSFFFLIHERDLYVTRNCESAHLRRSFNCIQTTFANFRVEIQESRMFDCDVQQS